MPPTRWFVLATMVSHWIFSHDYPNLLVKTNRPVSASHFILNFPQVDAAFNAMKGLLSEGCSRAYCNLHDHADSLFQDPPSQGSPSSTKTKKSNKSG